MLFPVSSRWSAEPPEQLLAPGFQLVDQRLLLLGGLDERRAFGGIQLVDQRLLLLGGLDERRAFGGIGWLFIPIADAPSQVDSCLPEPTQVVLDEPSLLGE